MADSDSINLFKVFPNTIIYYIYTSSTSYKNVEDLYNLNLESRHSLLDMVKFDKLNLIKGIAYAAGLNAVGELGTGDMYESHPILIDTIGNNKQIMTEDNHIGSKVIQVSAGDTFSLFLCEDGTAYSTGRNYDGQLGRKNDLRSYSKRPDKVVSDNMKGSPIVQVSAGYDHSLFLCEDGSAYGCGQSLKGQLGIDFNLIPADGRNFIPIEINRDNMTSRIIQVSAGFNCSLFVCEDGTAYSCGQQFDNDGKLGDGDDTYHHNYIPTPIRKDNMGDKKIIQASTGDDCLFLCEDGTAYACGSAGSQLGLGYINDNSVSIPTAVRKDNMGDKKIIQVCTPSEYTLCLCEDGSVYVCGKNDERLLGIDELDISSVVSIPIAINKDNLGNNLKKIVQISATYDSSLLLSEDGSVYVFGNGEYGKLGDGNSNTHLVTAPTLISSEYFNGEKVKQVSAGDDHSLFLI